MIKSKGNSLVKKKERYAVPQGRQNNLFENFLIKFARKEKERHEKQLLENIVIVVTFPDTYEP